MVTQLPSGAPLPPAQDAVRQAPRPGPRRPGGGGDPPPEDAVARRPPAHKVIPGTGFVVDSFRQWGEAVKAYFLSHAHSDHYGGLSETWREGHVYCNAATARLVAHLTGVQPSMLVALPMDTPVMVHGVEVTLVDACHCPGAAQLLFRLPDGRRYVHTGDFRFHPSLLENPALQAFRGAEALFLDTTYANPRHTFPPQEESVAYVAATIQRLMREAGQLEPPAAAAAAGKGAREQGQQEPAAAAGEGAGDEQGQLGRPQHRRLFCICTYGVGKENLLVAVHRATGTRLHVTPRKLGVLRCLQLPGGLAVDDVFTTDPAETPIRVVPWGFLGDTWPFFKPAWGSMEEYLGGEEGAEELVGFVPTGWVQAPKKDAAAAAGAFAASIRRKGPCSVHLVAYSEHSSYPELLEYVRFLRPQRVVPTVGVGGEGGDRALARMLRQFAGCVDQDANKRQFLAGMRLAAGSGGAAGASEAAAEEEVGEEGWPSDEAAAAADCCEKVAGRGEERPPSARATSPAGDEAGPSWPPPEDFKLLEELVAVIGQGGMTVRQARQLLARAENNLQAAVNLYFDSSGGDGGGGGASPGKASEPGPSPSQATPLGKKRPAGAAPKGSSGGKKARGGAAAVQGGQRSIRSFFSPAVAAPANAAAAGAVGTELEEPEAEGGQPTAEVEVVDLSVFQPIEGGPGFEVAKPPPASAPPPLPAEQEPPSPAPAQQLFGAKPAAASGRAAAVPRDATALPVADYVPLEHAPWLPGEATPYLHLSRAFEEMDSTTKRLKISDVLTNCFRSILALSPADLVPAAYLAMGKTGPDHEPNTELNVGGSTVAAALSEATGVSRSRLREMYTALGDLGDVAAACRQRQAMLLAPAPLTVAGVLRTLRSLAAERGPGAAARRQRGVLALLRAAREAESKYLVRSLVGALRLGANWRSVIVALARAALLHREGGSVGKARQDEVAAAASAAFHTCPDLGLLAAALLEHPPEEVGRHLTLTVGVPAKPMLARISEGIASAVGLVTGGDAQRAFLAEFKYDGMRAQCHLLPGGEVRVFSRNCEDRTPASSDVVRQLLEAAQGGGAESLVVDAEVVGVERDEAGGLPRLRAFQELAGRSRTALAPGESAAVDVCIFVFDLLYINGEALLGRPLRERRARLLQASRPLALPNMRPGRVALAQSWEVLPAALAADADAGVAEEPEGSDGQLGAATRRVEELLHSALSQCTEGLMLKALDGSYEPSRRSESWVKLKKDYCVGLADSVDVVPIGAWWGSGRKAGWFSPFLLAVYNPDSEQFESLCRCMSGFTDEFYRETTERLKHTVIPSPRPYYSTGEAPDIWFDCTECWEIRGADITISPVHRAAVGRIHPERGLGLRFPRFLRRREDKRPEDATSSGMVAQLFRAQTRKASHKPPEPEAPPSERVEEAGGEVAGAFSDEDT